MFPPGLYKKDKNPNAIMATDHAQKNVYNKNPNWHP
jgi:hypothetical protein